MHPEQPIDLILASSSPYRRQLLVRITDKFKTFSPDIDETPLGDQPRDLVIRLGLSKAKARLPENLQRLKSIKRVIIGSDQVACLNGQILGKPHTYENAFKQLKAASGQTVIFYTSLCLVIENTQTQEIKTKTHVDETLVQFQVLDDKTIEAYLKAEEPYDCAGSFKVEGLGISLFEKVINTDPTALMGLPLIKLCHFLKEEAYPIGIWK